VSSDGTAGNLPTPGSSATTESPIPSDATIDLRSDDEVSEEVGRGDTDTDTDAASGTGSDGRFPLGAAVGVGLVTALTGAAAFTAARRRMQSQ
jgi:hypothetical protein